ncbi:alpha/beta hydrolase [Nocardioides sp.]|uniref:alpha/beta hydrolase n=1 Tax=Nocardioides sp. TaxID=35761 RepID=UPI002726E8D4|nr:alpha/beta fold hydrolase [Nocardioides sp.]MDO9456415.1 alpha/beta fold hydrolase [Nocardioides sp.]
MTDPLTDPLTDPVTVTFLSGGDTIDAWHFAGAPDRPVVVMAHGLAGTKDSGLAAFARPLAEAGYHVLAFDYRGFGASGGAPRQTVSVAGQQADYRAAIDAARKLPGVDPTRVVLWGVSLAGGHVLAVAAGRDDVAAVIAVTPLVDGPAAGRLALQHHSLGSIARSTALGFRSRVGRGARMMPVVAAPGELGALTLDGAREDYLAMAGPTWVNEVDATVGLELGRHRPSKVAKDVTAPTLVQVADFDRSAPPQASMKAAFAARALVRHYPGDHFDVYAGKPWHDATVRHQLEFLARTFD